MYKIGYLFVSLVLLFQSTMIRASGVSLPDFTELVKDIAPTVVNISATRENQQKSQRGLLEEFFRRSPPSDNYHDFIPPQTSEGSGFILSEDGYVLTNRHVITQASEIIVRMNNGREFEAELIGEDSGTDVALLKIAADALPVITAGDSEQLKVGEWVLGFGAPFGFDQTVTAGIVSAKRRSLGREQYVPYIQTDVAINPGNSGGPLVNLEGKVVGINSQILSRSGGYIGLSFAIPIEVALHVVEQFKEYGEVKRGFLGVQYQDVTYELAQAFGMEHVEGALLNQVTKDSAAENAGLENGDIIIKLDNKPIRRAGELPFVVGLIKPGTTVKVDIVRKGKKMRLDLTVGERPKTLAANVQEETSPEADTLGLVVENLDDETREAIESEGVIITSVHNGPAAKAGLRQGDIILSLDNKDIKSVSDFHDIVSALPKGEGVPVLVFRRPSLQRFMTIRIPE